MILAACVGGLFGMPQVQEKKPIADPLMPLVVSDDLKRVEEASLLFNGSQANGLTAPTSGTPPVGGATKTTMADTFEGAREGCRILRFTLASRQRLRVLLRAAPEAEMALRFIRVSQTDPLAPQVKVANLPPLVFRRKSIQIENPQDAPRECLLYLSGRTGFAYALDLERLPLR
jgi:hypothetical protein